MTNTNLLKSTLITGVTLLLATTSNVQASECKGLNNESCSAKEACGWVETYTRKDGREVNAFCRTSTKGRVKISDKKDVVNKTAS